MQKVRKLYNRYHNLYLGKCHGESNRHFFASLPC